MEFKHHLMIVGGHQLYRGRIAITVEKVVDCKQSAFSLKIRRVRDRVSAFGTENAAARSLRKSRAVL